MDSYDIWYQRKDDPANPKRELLFTTVRTDANAADRIAKNLLDDFVEVVHNAWAEKA